MGLELSTQDNTKYSSNYFSRIFKKGILLMELFKKDIKNMKMGDANVFAIVVTSCIAYILLLGISDQCLSS
jgi:hypothetical protein